MMITAAVLPSSRGESLLSVWRKRGRKSLDLSSVSIYLCDHAFRKAESATITREARYEETECKTVGSFFKT